MRAGNAYPVLFVLTSSMLTSHQIAIVGACFVAYLLTTLWIGWAARSKRRSAGDYLNASRSLSLPVVATAFLAANCGALEVVGLSAMAAQYGVQAFHFYWIGAIPAMVFLSLFMMPIYRRSGVRSVPEYLLVRYGPRARLLNALATAIVLLLLSGISLYAMAVILSVFLNLSYVWGVSISAAVVLIYVLLGGVRATIYNEVLQLGIMLAGFVPLAIRCAKYATVNQNGSGVYKHLWTSLPPIKPHAPMDALGVVFGLGFVLSVGYWCTDFVLMQRAFTARTEFEARQVPLWAGFGKLAFSMIVVLPGLAAYRLLPTTSGALRFDETYPSLMRTLYSPAMLGLGVTALAASLLSALAANVSAFAAVWTEDIYRVSIHPGLVEERYLRVGKAAIVSAVLVSIGTSYLNFFFLNLMEHVQLVFSVFGSPFWAIFLLGMLTKKTSERGAIIGFVAGSAFGAIHSIGVVTGWLHYGSVMTGNFYAAIFSFSIALTVAWFTSRGGSELQPSVSLQIGDAPWSTASQKYILYALALLLLLLCGWLNFQWK